ncbi:flagellar hook-length control protein FliK [Sulfurospirillum oryzae]|uniref:flagellar hook-length control protein FliK n=1 Tax=Sulfurospirillum oryzae TaxID=2976535 RepID=UPI0021E99D06|nr:flagellar hook-length control protein FliK [Sulfurospirillum oryzae]
MQDILSFAQAPSPIALAPSTTKSVTPAGNDGSFSESFFSIILGQFTQESKQTSLNDLAQELPTTSVSENLNLNAKDQKAKSVDEHLLDDLLSVVNALQQNSQITVFPTLKPSSTLEKILGSETARQDFANVKSVSDLMDLSKKYNLGLEKLSISQENLDSLQTKFPKLAQSNFFDDLQSALDSAKTSQKSDVTLPTTVATTPTTNVMNLLDKQPVQTETTPVTSILSELISKDVKPEPTKTQPVELNNKVDVVVDEAPSMVNEKQQNTLAQALQAPQEETKQVVSAPLETAIQKVVTPKETKKTSSQPIEPTVQEPVTQEEPIQVATTRVNEVKKEPLLKSEENVVDLTPKTTKTEKTLDESSQEEMAQLQKTAAHDDKETTKTSSEETQSTLEVKTDIKTTSKQETTVKNTPVKESLNQFATDLKEKIEAYKPPIMKVELSLSPKNLGDVDVTLLTRGNNLHVNISSNTNTMSLFTQNQNDVKNALVSMGFTNLEMNFSDQRNSNQSQQNQQKSSGNFEEFTTESSEEETASLEIVIPQYV